MDHSHNAARGSRNAPSNGNQLPAASLNASNQQQQQTAPSHVPGTQRQPVEQHQRFVNPQQQQQVAAGGAQAAHYGNNVPFNNADLRTTASVNMGRLSSQAQHDIIQRARVAQQQHAGMHFSGVSRATHNTLNVPQQQQQHGAVNQQQQQQGPGWGVPNPLMQGAPVVQHRQQQQQQHYVNRAVVAAPVPQAPSVRPVHAQQQHQQQQQQLQHQQHRSMQAVQHQAAPHQAVQHQAVQQQPVQHQAAPHQAVQQQAVQHQAAQQQAVQNQAAQQQAVQNQHQQHRPVQQVAQQPRPRQPGVTVQQSTVPGQKPKVILSSEAKQALAKAIWSAIRSPIGQISPDLMEVALQTGLPRHAIVNAARVAREREALKRKRMQQQQQQQSGQEPPKAPTGQIRLKTQPAPVSQPVVVVRKPLPSSPKPSSSSIAAAAAAAAAIQQQKDAQRKAMERVRWKRVQNGVFMVQKGRFLAVPFSVGAMVRSKNVEPVVKQGPGQKRSRAKVLQQAAALQKQLLAIQQPPPSTPGVLSAGTTAQTRPVVTLLLDPEKFKRIKIEPKKFAKALDRFARKSRQSVAETLSKQHKELNKSIGSHHQEFNKFHRQRKADAFRLAKTVRDSFDKEEKKKEKDAVQHEKARLAALKANDMTAYSKLLEETKNDRLKFLLNQTEKQFTKISSLLQARTSEDHGSESAAPGTSYYASAHLKTEEVRQPSILVGGDLKNYQLMGLQWMVSLYNNKLNGILADEMGLGKTIQAIALIAYLMEYKQNLGPYLVIVPLSTLSNWQNEFTKWCPSARVICYKGTPTQRKEIYKDQVRTGHFNVLLTTYEYIIRDKKFLHKIDWQYAIVDEGHRMKNAQSKFAVTLATQYTTKFRVLLTGTPLMNDLSELWALLNFLLPAIFNSVETFDDWFSRPFSQFSNANEEESDDMLSNEERVLIIHRLHELLRPFMLRRVKSEVLDQLPEKVEKVLRCELSSWQKELYKQISAKAVAENSVEQQGPTRGLNNVVMQLRKVCNHPYLFSPEGYHVNETIIRSSGKVALLDQMLPKLKAAGHRVLMFTQMTAVMTIMEDYFSYRGYLSLRLDGSTPAEEREKRMYKFNAPDSPYFIFLLSTRAGGLGLNLTAADTVIIFDSDWNPMMDLQAQDRAHRIGQRSDVSVFRLITYSPVEEKILSRATEKLNVSELVVESGKFNKDSVESDNSLERKKMMEVLLTDFDTTPQSSKVDPKAASEKSGSDDGGDEEDSGSESSDKEDLNELLSNNEADYALYTALDVERDEDGGILAPLYTNEADVPEWIRSPQQTGNSRAFVSAGAEEGNRKRKAVTYDDGLTEKQFLRMMDKQTIAEENSRKRAKVERSSAASNAMEDGDDDEPMSMDNGSALTDWTYRKLISCSKSVVALKDPSTKRRISEIFLEKPDPAAFPDYYEIVDKPVGINDILRKCRAKLYPDLREFKADWQLMFANARKFNGETSWVVEDASALEKELERVLKKNGFTDDDKPPTSKKKKKLRIKLSLKGLKARASEPE